LYIHFGEYCQNALGEAYTTNPLLVVGSFEGAIKYHEILKLGDYDRIGDHMVEAVFKKLEGERSSKITVEKLVSSLKLEIETDAIDRAL
jgi:hypothetical protein